MGLGRLPEGKNIHDVLREAGYEMCQDCGDWFNPEDLTRVTTAVHGRMLLCSRCASNAYYRAKAMGMVS